MFIYVTRGRPTLTRYAEPACPRCAAAGHCCRDRRSPPDLPGARRIQHRRSTAGRLAGTSPVPGSRYGVPRPGGTGSAPYAADLSAAWRRSWRGGSSSSPWACRPSARRARATRVRPLKELTGPRSRAVDRRTCGPCAGRAVGTAPNGPLNRLMDPANLSLPRPRNHRRGRHLGPHGYLAIGGTVRNPPKISPRSVTDDTEATPHPAPDDTGPSTKAPEARPTELRTMPPVAFSAPTTCRGPRRSLARPPLPTVPALEPTGGDEG